MGKIVILSLGGSVIFPESIDVNFLKSLKKTIEKFVRKNHKFVIYCGGGKLARNYQKAASQILNLKNEDLDWLGIEATKLNAKFIKILFKNNAEEFIIEDPTKKIIFNKKILVASGWKPGWSTDYDAVLLAKNLKIKEIINMSNVDYVYDKDPKKNKKAKKIKNICWKHYTQLIGNKWKAGLNAPFDPIAAREAEKSNLKVFIIGKNLKNFENLLNDKKFIGTIIE